MTESRSSQVSLGLNVQASRQDACDRSDSVDGALVSLLNEYNRCRQPIEVSFRHLIGTIPVNDLSHSIYPYPARLLRQIPRFLLRSKLLIEPGNLVLDPFCGSGTVLVEARAAGLNSWGIDSNPFARLLSEVKTTPLPQSETLRALAQVLRLAKRSRSNDGPTVVNVDFWYSESAKKALGRLYCAIHDGDYGGDIQRFLLVALALTAERCSRRDPRIPVPVRRENWQSTSATSREVWTTFDASSRFLAGRIASIPSGTELKTIIAGEHAADSRALFDAELCRLLPRPRMILTSPPYGAAQKYVRSTSLALGWTGLCQPEGLAALEQRMTGREHLRKSEITNLEVPLATIAQEVALIAKRDQVRAAIYADYFREMDKALSSLAQLLDTDGVFVLVAGTNHVSGYSMQTHAHLRSLACRNGLRPILELHDTIRGRTLLTKRDGSRGIPLTYEAIHILKKDVA